ncbi:MAG: hypothetical protein AAF805_04455 [Planctomycetota bacterium]
MPHETRPDEPFDDDWELFLPDDEPLPDPDDFWIEPAPDEDA